MKLGIYSVRDLKADYWPPTFEVNDASALRNFKFLCSKDGTLPNFAASDYEFYKIGIFDTENATIEVIDKEVLS